MTDQKPPRFLRLPAVKDRLGIGRDLIYKLVRRGLLAPPHRISDRASGWLEADIESYIAACVAKRGSK